MKSRMSFEDAGCRFLNNPGDLAGRVKLLYGLDRRQGLDHVANGR